MDNPVSSSYSKEKLPIETDAWRLIESDGLEIIELHLHPGEVISKHKNQLDVIFYVLEGGGDLYIGSATYSLNKGDCIFVEKEKERSWVNCSGKIIKLLVIKKTDQ